MSSHDSFGCRRLGGTSAAFAGVFVRKLGIHPTLFNCCLDPADVLLHVFAIKLSSFGVSRTGSAAKSPKTKGNECQIRSGEVAWLGEGRTCSGWGHATDFECWSK